MLQQMEYFIHFMDSYYSIVYTFHVFLIQLFVYGHLVCTHVLTIINRDALDIGYKLEFLSFQVYNQGWNCWIRLYFSF